MHRFPQLGLICIGVVLILAGCASSGPTVVATVGKELVTLDDFEASYAKHNGGWGKGAASTQEDRERFLDRLVNFRLEVLEATERGLTAHADIKSEMERYKYSVATSFLLEREVVEPKIRQLYGRKAEDVRISHILVKLDPDAPPSDTIEAYRKAMKIIGLVPTEVFDTLAVRYSDDESARFNRGNLGYNWSGRMSEEIEAASYQLKTGEYTHFPVRSQIGYHIIKATGRQKSKGAVRVSHILWRFTDSANDSLGLRDTVWMVYNQLRAGLDFAAAAKQYSQDPATNQKGGDLGAFEHGKILPDMESLFFSTPLDSVTRPLMMPYGYHIFKVTAYTGAPPFEEIEKDLRQTYQQTMYNADYENYLRSLKTRYHLTFDEATLDRLAHSLDTTLTPSSPAWSDVLGSGFRTNVLFLCDNRPYTVNDFVQFVNATAEFISVFFYPGNVRHMAERMSETKVIERNADLVTVRYPEFSRLLKDHQDEIVLYRIAQDEIWKKISVNDSLLIAYYNDNKEKFRWPKRVSFSEILLTSDSLAQRAYKEILSGRPFGDVAEEYTTREGYKEKKGVWELMPDTLNYYSRYAAILPVDSLPPPFAHPDGWSIIKVLAKEGARVKTYEESLPELVGAYQEYAAKVREQQWVRELKARYPVVVRKELLVDAFKKRPSIR